MTAPDCVIETIAKLREERLPAAALVDAIDLAIDNISRVFGMHGSPQPLPLGTGDDWTDPVERRQFLVAVLRKAGDRGLTLRELRAATPSMSGKQRSNALQLLQKDGAIRRIKKTWRIA